MSFVETILTNLTDDPERVVLEEIVDDSKRATKGEELARLVARARTAIAQAGVEHGDRVALLGPNSAHWVAADLAILAEGAIMVPLYSRQDPNELAEMLSDCAPRLLICANDALATAIERAWPADRRPDPVAFTTYTRLFAAEPTAAGPYPLAESDAVTIIYTSGTSGVPKGVILSRANVDFMLPTTAAAIAEIQPAKRDEDAVFHFLPFCFAGSRIMLWTQLYRGNPLMMSTDLANLAVEMGVADPHYTLNVPAVLERIRTGVSSKLTERGGVAETLYTRGLQAGRSCAEGKGTVTDQVMLRLARQFVFPKIKAEIGSRLQFLICGSAPLSAETQAWFELIGIPVYQVYGLTETTAIVTMDKLGQAAPGKVGQPIEGCELKVADDGELICRGPNIFAGYWKRPEDTAEALVDGWFHSGDQAEVDEQGRWRIVGRLRNILVPESGHNVAPEPLEQALRAACDDIEHAVLVGHGRPYLTAIITGTAVTNQAAQSAIDSVNMVVPHYRKIRGFHLSTELLTVESGLLTANQKLRRKVIEAHYHAQIEELYAR